MHSDLLTGLKLPSYTALVVVDGTISDPVEIAYLMADVSSRDAIAPNSLTTLAQFLANGYYIVARLYIDNVNNTSRLIYANSNSETSRLNFHRRSLA